MMKKLQLLNFIVFTGLIAFSPAVVQSDCAKVDLGGYGFEIEVDTGLRHDQVNWNIAGPNNEPNVLSELEWNDIHSYQVGGTVEMATPYNQCLRLSGDYARIYHGTNRDSDYLEDDRQLEFSRSSANASKGHVYDLSLAWGYVIHYKQLTLIPLLGISESEQHLTMYDGSQVIDTITEGSLGSFIGLDSTYHTRWDSAWIGGEIAFEIGSCIKVIASVEYHWARYHGRGHWNLRTDFLEDFHHHASGDGQVYKLTGFYPINNNWSIGVKGKYQQWSTRRGVAHVTIEEGRFGVPLNRVNWKSYDASIVLAYRY